MNYVWKDIADKKTYDGFLLNQSRSYFIQSYNYGLSKKNTNHKVIRRGLLVDGQLKVVYTGILETFKLGSRLNIMSGPVGTNGDSNLIKSFTEEIKLQGLRHNFVFARIKPLEEVNQANKDKYKKLKWSKAPVSIAHVCGVIDLKKSKKTIRSNMNKDLRRRLNKLESLPIKVRKRTSLKAAKLIYNLHLKDAQKKRYAAYDRKMVLELFKNYNKDGQVSIYQAEFNQKVLGMTLVLFFGSDAYCYMGVRTLADQKFSCSPLLDLASIIESQDRKMKFYNFGGIVGKDQVNHSHYGLSQYKRRFGVEEFKKIRALDLIIKPIRYLPIYARQKQFKIINKL